MLRLIGGLIGILFSFILAIVIIAILFIGYIGITVMMDSELESGKTLKEHCIDEYNKTIN